MSLKKHKKHKSEKRDRQDGGDKPPGLRLILKMNSSTPENSCDSMGLTIDEDSSRMSATSSSQMLSASARDDTLSSTNPIASASERAHKKAKKKKKKKEKDRDKHSKKHKHHHKEKRKRRDESSQDDGSVGEESLSEIPAKRIDPGTSASASVDDLAGRDADASRDASRDAHREPRSCVLRQRQERLPLQRLLEHILKGLEKKDPTQLFAWPVTDNIAPEYSQIIKNPMDFSTMKHKIDNCVYTNVAQFVDDFKLLCNNAMVYNQSHTIYFKQAKKLLHAGLKMMSPEKLRPLKSVLPYMADIGREALGFEVEPDMGHGAAANGAANGVAGLGDRSAAAADATGATPAAKASRLDGGGDDTMEADSSRDGLGDSDRKRSKMQGGKFEAIADDMTAEEILEHAHKVHDTITAKLAARKLKTSMGFLRQRKDGTTSLNILVPGDGVIPGTVERPVSLGTITGKLTHGTGTLQGFREDRRNLAKPVKPLYYGAFGSYAPSHDSTFANLSKEESDLVYQTYGDEISAQYAESILDFTKDSDYTITMVDNLLDIVTHGEHRRTKKTLEERRKMREEEERLQAMMDGARSNDAAKPQGSQPQGTKSNQGESPSPAQPCLTGAAPAAAAGGVANQAAAPAPAPAPATSLPPVNINSLKSLKELGIDTGFLDVFERSQRDAEDQRNAQLQLNVTGNLLEKLQQVQSDRLSQAPPPHLSQVMQPSIAEQQLAEKITENLTDLAKRVPPAVIVPVAAVRKALGVAPCPDLTVDQTVDQTVDIAREREEPTTSKGRVDAILSANLSKDASLSEGASNSEGAGSGPGPGPGPATPSSGDAGGAGDAGDGGDAGGATSTSVSLSASAAENQNHSNSSTAIPDLETELREFLESEPTLSNTALHDEQSMEIEDILSGP